MSPHSVRRITDIPYCVSNNSIRIPSAKDLPVPASHFSTKTARQTVRMRQIKLVNVRKFEVSQINKG